MKCDIDESKLPPRPTGDNGPNADPDSPLVRYGRASADSGLLLEPMADGYWTPWHIANEMLRASVSLLEVQSGETWAQREEVCAAWADLPDALRCHPGLKRLYRALGGLRMDDPAQSPEAGK